MARELQQRLQREEGLNMPLGTTQAKEDASGASGMLRATFTILTNNKFTKIYPLSW